ncbi:MAG: hypothetical protein AAF288_02860 [Planctomycetota bacterium]
MGSGFMAFAAEGFLLGAFLLGALLPLGLALPEALLAVWLAGLPAGFAELFLAGDFLLAGFFDADFFAVGFLEADFLVTGFLAAGLRTAVFFFVVFLATFLGAERGATAFAAFLTGLFLTTFFLEAVFFAGD